jgi:toxin CcdB
MSRQFDVVPNPDATDVAERPYVVILQSDLVSGLSSTVVAPLVPRASMTGAHRLNPLVTVQGQEYWLAMHELFAMDRRMLRREVASVDDQRDAIIAALDLLFTGF